MSDNEIPIEVMEALKKAFLIKHPETEEDGSPGLNERDMVDLVTDAQVEFAIKEADEALLPGMKYLAEIILGFAANAIDHAQSDGHDPRSPEAGAWVATFVMTMVQKMTEALPSQPFDYPVINWIGTTAETGMANEDFQSLLNSTLGMQHMVELRPGVWLGGTVEDDDGPV